jgi:hypothetical protein
MIKGALFLELREENAINLFERLSVISEYLNV